MELLTKLKVGDKVYYQPEHYKEDDNWENGMVKEIPDHTNTAVRVVYNCAGEWDRFKEYTSALTDLRDLKLGWRITQEEIEKHFDKCDFDDTCDVCDKPENGSYAVGYTNDECGEEVDHYICGKCAVPAIK